MRTVLTVDDATFSLAPGQDAADLERRIESAVTEGGRFVHFAVSGDADVSVLFTAHTRVVLWAPENQDGMFDGELPTVEWDDG